MAITVLSPLPLQHFVDDNGVLLAGGQLFTYAAGTTTKLATYTDETGATPNTNPIILNSRGEAGVWLPPGVPYKFTLSPSTDTDPPTDPFWTVDQLASPVAITTVPEFPTLPASTSYSNDIEAAAGGISIGQIYRNGNVLQVRVN